MDNSFVRRLFQIESGGNPYAVTGSNRGLGQFGPAEERQYGITDANRSDPNAQAAAVQREVSQFAPILSQKLGRAPTPGELYLMHQQGIAGGPALLTADPNMPAWQAIRPFYGSDAVAKQAIAGNLPKDSGLGADAPAGAFTNYWVNKFEGGMGGAQPSYAALNQPPLTPGDPAPALPPGINIGGMPQQMAAVQTPQLPGILGGAQPQQQAQQQGGLLNLAGLLGAAAAKDDLPMPAMQMPSPQIAQRKPDLSPLMSFLRQRQQQAAPTWAFANGWNSTPLG